MKTQTHIQERQQGRNISTNFLADRAKFMRKETVRLSRIAGAGHYSSTFSAAELLVALYYAKLNIRPLEPDWPDRDRFVLSKGHAAIGLYPILADLGFYDAKLLDQYTRFGSPFGDHPDMKKVKGIDFSSGSLGHGLSVCVGLALAARMQARDHRVFCMLGDGELAEGQIWEAAMSATHFEPLTDRFQGFGWETLRIDGHNFEQIIGTLDALPSASVGRPTVIIADTVKGRGVARMEGELNWHVGNLECDDYAAVMAELDAGLKPATWQHSK